MPSIIASIVRGLQRRKAERTLHELDDHLLRDIGVERHMIGRPSARRTLSL